MESLLTIAKHPGVVALFKTNIAKAKTLSPVTSQAPILQKVKAPPVDKQVSSKIRIKEYGTTLYVNSLWYSNSRHVGGHGLYM